MDVYEIGKSIIVFAVIPVIAWLYRRLDNSLFDVEKRVSALEAEHKVMIERVDNLRQDLVEIKAMLHQILSRVQRG